jgi:hypothetical protein
MSWSDVEPSGRGERRGEAAITNTVRNSRFLKSPGELLSDRRIDVGLAACHGAHGGQQNETYKWLDVAAANDG